ncbi:uncharacterized protein PV06_05759 [Exophiala oligosperma]|uniref:Xylanolytic transcriptional activator regulatory domain-containing protein n=1 Tax=Exophiala oligosperma TaxID=215243 RepID=A0A0D2DIB3_9EURO|nr:uncharacterized protein PV06_05759 [Exophiala oligosperma]KIW42190.1 hypothetical protein PV06_05759 [Exophiala oligosperma]
MFKISEQSDILGESGRNHQDSAELSPGSIADETSISTESELIERESIDCIHSGHRVYNSFAVQIATLKNAASPSPSAMSKGDEPIGTASNRTPSNCAQMGIHPRAIRNDIKTFISSSTRLRYLLNLFFDEYHYLYPCIDQDRFDIQLQGLFEHYSVHQDCLFLSAGEPESLVFAALTCKILAIAEHIEADGQSPTTTTNELPPERNVRGQAWDRESARLLGLASQSADDIMDTVRLFMLEVLYMLMRENFRKASQALCRAVELAFALGLNDESTWAGCSIAEARSRRVLWWTIYFFDRRMAYRLGRPYMIRDSEVAVADFTADIRTMESMPPPALHLSTSTPTRISLDVDWFHYLQFNLGWGRLFAKAWDSLYSLTSPRAGNVEEIEIMETLLAKLKRSLPTEMKWRDTLSSSGSTQPPDVPDRKIRMSLVVYTICHKLAASTVEAIVSYIRTRRRERSFGTYATMCIIESLYYMLSMPSSTTNNNSSRSIDTFDDFEATKNLSLEQAWECLNDLSCRRLAIATNALKVLKGIIETRVGNQQSLLQDKPTGASLNTCQNHRPSIDQEIITNVESRQRDHAQDTDFYDVDLFSIDSQFVLPDFPGSDLDREGPLSNDMGIWDAEQMIYSRC